MESSLEWKKKRGTNYLINIWKFRSISVKELEVDRKQIEESAKVGNEER